MKIGNISFNPEALKDLTREEFYNLVKGKIDIDKSEAWEMLQQANGNIKEISGKSKRVNGK
jgi:hypothetical protein